MALPRVITCSFSYWVCYWQLSLKNLLAQITYTFNSFSVQPLTILGVTGPFSVLAENIYSLCINAFDVSAPNSGA